ncbi:MAG: OsmC family protein [Granulosicoccus sp.]|nr:OsmC family protein [Granulosicoccus sp.]
MSRYFSKTIWLRQSGEDFIGKKYSRGHIWEFDGGVRVPASASPHIVPLPYSVEENVDPEEAFVASLSSCHMLFFLDIASSKRYIIDSYTDEAVGVMEKNESGVMMMTKVTLRPAIIFSGENQPTEDQIEKIHHRAHSMCFIANSVKTEVLTEPVYSATV